MSGVGGERIRYGFNIIFFFILLSIKHVLEDKIMNLNSLKNSTFGLSRSTIIKRQLIATSKILILLTEVSYLS